MGPTENRNRIESKETDPRAGTMLLTRKGHYKSNQGRQGPADNLATRVQSTGPRRWKAEPPTSNI